jgi:hypothetical protein
MTRYFVASALAVTGALGFAQNANAQYSFGYQTYVPGAGVVLRSQTVATPFGIETVNRTYSPFTGYSARQLYYGDVWGNRAATMGGYNPYLNLGYRSGLSYGPTYYGVPAYNQFGYYYRR